jgi:hypothetical protein
MFQKCRTAAFLLLCELEREKYFFREKAIAPFHPFTAYSVTISFTKYARGALPLKAMRPMTVLSHPLRALGADCYPDHSTPIYTLASLRRLSRD